MNINNNDIISFEKALLGIFANNIKLIDKIHFDEKYFKVELHQKVYIYLKEVKHIDHFKMLKYLNSNEIEEFITNIYTKNIYTCDVENVAIGLANTLIEVYKQNQILNLNNLLKNKQINSIDYFKQLDDIKNINIVDDSPILTEEIIDKYIFEDDEYLEINKFPVLSKYLNINKTDFITVAAVTGFGKSAFLMNIFFNLSLSDKNKCQYFNIEISQKLFVKRMISIASNKEMGSFTKKDDTYYEARNKILNKNLVMHSGYITLEKLKSTVLNNIDSNKTNIIFIDHIGLLGIEDKNYATRSEYERITYCTKELRQFALQYNLIIFIASQVDRGSIKGNGLTINSLKSSGELENSSTHVLLLKKSKIIECEDTDPFFEEMIDVCKNRNGRIDKLDYYTFIKEKQIFEEKIR
ncbi:MAG: hypothetical protein LUG60_02240 [Erysipelotrichaceae bacterium]|nr:hypothetical protein [Erysipelotrichaceae bacterium]